jgi:uncharacterized protein YqeY
MGLRDDINASLKEAMKAGDKARVSTLRMMNAAIKDKDISGRTAGHESAPTSDAGVIELFAKMVKQRHESVAAYEQGGRQDLADQEKAEIAVIQFFMPKQMGDEEVKAAIMAAIAATGAASIKDMGKVIAELKGKYAGQMDFSKAGPMVKAALAGG